MLGGELFPPEIYKPVDRVFSADGTPDGEVNIQSIKINLKERVQIPQKK